jgi:hypothetical protein
LKNFTAHKWIISAAIKKNFKNNMEFNKISRMIAASENNPGKSCIKYKNLKII